MKKILTLFIMLGVLFVFAACGNDKKTTTTTVTTKAPTTVTTKAPTTVTTKAPTTVTTKAPTTTTKAPTTTKVTTVETKTDVFIIGDSTLCAFNDTTYYYPRYGYGTQLANYFDSSIRFTNYALSGRSSKSFTTETNYIALWNNIGAGDYLIIGFGHNDEKSDDSARFTDATLPLDDPNSFKYSLYNNYIVKAVEAGATPILATPIVRANTSNDYTGDSAHITATGNYSQAIIDLATEKGLVYIDLTKLTKDLYTELTFEEAKYLHAMTGGMKDTDNTTIIADANTVDKTHLNIYGAKMVAYMFANELKGKTCDLASHVLTDITAPTKETDLVVNSSYTYVDYSAPNLAGYSPKEFFTTTTDGFYGTAFGDTGATPDAVAADGSNTNGYYAQETSEGVFKVGQTLASGSNKGKFANSADGFAFLFTQVDVNKNFTMTASAKVLTTGNTKQAGFGLMLRDDCYLPVKNAGIIGNYVAAGFLCNSTPADGLTVGWSRDSKTTLTKSSDVYSGAFYAVDDEAQFTITRLGQKITVETVYKGTTYTQEYLDFPLTVTDTNYMYIGMFANRGTTVEFTNVTFNITGDAIEA